jgi:rpsU-divergently transcribed protein
MPTSPFCVDDMALLRDFLAALPEKGLSWQTFLGVSPSLVVAITAVPLGEAGLFDFVKHGCGQAVADHAGRIVAAPRTRDRVTEGALAFLDVFAASPMALSVLMAAKPVGFQGLLWSVADEIWHCAGDTATDHNYYTKRALLSQILLHAVLVMTGGQPYALFDMRAFLQRDIARVFSVMRPLSGLKTFFQGIGSSFPSPKGP